MSWKLVGHAPKAVVQAALAAHEALDEWDGGIVLTGSEIAEDRPDEWVLEAYLPHRPDKADKAAITALFGSNAPRLAAEKLPDTDWVAETQKLVAPIRAGRFHVHTLDYAADTAPDTVDLVVPAAQAFGTGQHATTAGCLAMLDLMKRRGTVVRNFADVGTGTGLLAFAALRLWPGARAVASDIDAVCEFADAVEPCGSVLLAGLLVSQEPAVRAAYRTAGFRLAARLVNGDWSILWLRRRSI